MSSTLVPYICGIPLSSLITSTKSVKGRSVTSISWSGRGILKITIPAIITSACKPMSVTITHLKNFFMTPPFSIRLGLIS